MRALSPALLLALACLAIPGTSQAGFGIADPLELHVHVHVQGLHGVRLSGRVMAVGWRGRGASIAPRRLPAPVALDGFTAATPVGAWTDLVLVLDGPVTLTAETDAGAPVTLRLSVDTLVVPLQEPTAGAPRTVALDLVLPDWLAGAARGGLVVGPGDALHDRLVAALQDGLLAIAR